MKKGLYGSGGGGGGGGGSTRVSQEAPNTLRSRATSRAEFLLGEGVIGGLVDGAKSIFFDDTPLEAQDGTLNYEGVTWWERVGTPDQEHVEGFPDAENEISVAAEAKANTPITRTITNPNNNAVRVRMRLPLGLLVQDKSTGDLNPSSVSYKISVRPSGGAFVEVVNETIQGKCTSAYERAHRIELSGSAPWDIQVERTTPDATDSSVRDSLQWASMTEIIDLKMTYPNSAYIALAVDSEKFGGSIPQVSFEVLGRIVRVPANYDPQTRAYDGLWDGTFKLAWTDNPAWCVYDILRCDRAGLGLSDEALESTKWLLYEIAQYCDELVPDGFGGMEPRFRMNCVLQTQEEAYHVINAMVSSFRGMCWWGSGAVSITQDRPKEASHIVSPANVVDGSLNYESTSLTSRHSVAYVTWNDPADAFRPGIEPYEDDEFIRALGWRKTDIMEFGCTSQGQASRKGRWVVETEQRETQILSFTGGWYFADAAPGNILKVMDPQVAGARAAGGVKSATASQVVLDAPVTLAPGESYLLSVVLPNMQVVDRDLTNLPGETDTLDLAVSLPEAPLAGAWWCLTTSSVQPRYFMVVSNNEASPGKFDISALEHDPDKYQRVEQGWKLDPRPTSRIPTGALPAPSMPALDEKLHMVGASAVPSVLFSWEHPSDPRVRRYEVQIKRPSYDWAYYGVTESNSIEITNTPAGAYGFRVRSLDDFGTCSPKWLQVDDVAILGLNQAPDVVSNFATVYKASVQVLTWDRVNDIRAIEYEIRRGSAWSTAQVVHTTSDNQAPTFGDGTYLIKAKCASGYSENAAMAVVDGAALRANVIASFDEDATWWSGSVAGSAQVVNGSIALDVSGGGPLPIEGSYTIPAGHQVSLGQAALCNVDISYELTGNDIHDDLYAVPDVYAMADVYGAVGEFVQAEAQIRTYQDGAWGEWKKFVPGQYFGEKFDARVILRSLKADVTAVLRSFVFSVDVPDRVEVRTSLAVPAAGLRVNFDPPFNAPPTTVALVVGASGGEDIVISNESATGYDIRVKLGGSWIASTINAITQGY